MPAQNILLRLRLQGAAATKAGLVGVARETDRLGKAQKASAANALAAAKVGAIASGVLVAGALNVAGDYEKSLNVFQATSSATGVEMRKAGALAKQLGADVKLPGTSAADAAQAMTQLAKGGISVRDTFAATRSVLQLSAAAQIDNAQAADIVSKALNTFGMKGREAADVANLLAAASMKGATVTDLAAGMQQAGAGAKALGVPLKDTVAALTLFAKNGVTGSDAGTSLKTMFQRLIPQSHDAADMMKKLGVDVFDAKGKFIGVRGAIAEYSKALAGKSAEEKANALNTLFGSDASRAANILLVGGTKAYDKMSKAVGRAGAAQKVADAQTKGFKGSLEGFKSTLETLGVTFGTVLLPPATAAMGFLSGAFGALGEHKTATMVLVGVIGGLAVTVLTVNTAYKAYRAIQAAVVVINTVAAASFWRLNAALYANPIGLVVLALVAIGAGMVIAYKRSAKFRSVVDSVWGTLKSTFGWVKSNWPLLLAILTGPFGLAALVIAKNFDKIKGIAEGALNWLVARLNNAVSVINLAIKAYNAIPLAKDIGLVGKIGPVGGDKSTGRRKGFIPALAGGGVIARGGMAWVGENGPEPVSLPTGAVVHRADSAMARGGGMDEAAMMRFADRIAARPIVVKVGEREFLRAWAVARSAEAAFS